ncbi:MAG TPA: hypothetical protein VJ978_04520 [Nitriliruptoraceae bacterium]|nr:hypothetical protein [Nitriliruptoraceae bacterium]
MSAMSSLVVLAQATTEPTPVGPWIVIPTLVMLAAAVAAAPIWPWSRQWGWPVAGMFGVTAATAAMFSVAWLYS